MGEKERAEKRTQGKATPTWPRVPFLVAELNRIRKEAGVRPEELLEGLDEQRKQLYRERYGAQAR